MLPSSRASLYAARPGWDAILYATPSLRIRLPFGIRERSASLRAAVQLPLGHTWLHNEQHEEVWSLREGERALVVHFWASWCPECEAELPGLERAVRDCAGDVRIVAVNVGESVDVARRFLERHDSALPLYRDPEGRVWRRLARGLPANLIWTRASGRTEIGPKSPSNLLHSLGCRSMEIP